MPRQPTKPILVMFYAPERFHIAPSGILLGLINFARQDLQQMAWGIHRDSGNPAADYAIFA